MVNVKGVNMPDNAISIEPNQKNGGSGNFAGLIAVLLKGIQAVPKDIENAPQGSDVQKGTGPVAADFLNTIAAVIGFKNDSVLPGNLEDFKSWLQGINDNSLGEESDSDSDLMLKNTDSVSDGGLQSADLVELSSFISTLANLYNNSSPNSAGLENESLSHAYEHSGIAEDMPLSGIQKLIHLEKGFGLDLNEPIYQDRDSFLNEIVNQAATKYGIDKDEIKNEILKALQNAEVNTIPDTQIINNKPERNMQDSSTSVVYTFVSDSNRQLGQVDANISINNKVEDYAKQDSVLEKVVDIESADKEYSQVQNVEDNTNANAISAQDDGSNDKTPGKPLPDAENDINKAVDSIQNVKVYNSPEIEEAAVVQSDAAELIQIGNLQKSDGPSLSYTSTQQGSKEFHEFDSIRNAPSENNSEDKAIDDNIIKNSSPIIISEKTVDDVDIGKVANVVQSSKAELQTASAPVKNVKDESRATAGINTLKNEAVAIISNESNNAFDIEHDLQKLQNSIKQQNVDDSMKTSAKSHDKVIAADHQGNKKIEALQNTIESQVPIINEGMEHQSQIENKAQADINNAKANESSMVFNKAIDVEGYAKISTDQKNIANDPVNNSKADIKLPENMQKSLYINNLNTGENIQKVQISDNTSQNNSSAETGKNFFVIDYSARINRMLHKNDQKQYSSTLISWNSKVKPKELGKNIIDISDTDSNNIKAKLQIDLKEHADTTNGKHDPINPLNNFDKNESDSTGTMDFNNNSDKPKGHSEGLNHEINKIHLNLETVDKNQGKSINNIQNKNFPNPITNYENIAEAAIKGFKAVKLPEINELRVKVNPEELGEIVVKVVLEKGQINGSITAEKIDTAAILHNNVENLRQELRNSNVNLSNLSVNIDFQQNGSGSSQGGFYGNPGRDKRNPAEPFVNETEEEKEKGFEIIA